MCITLSCADALDASNRAEITTLPKASSQQLPGNGFSFSLKWTLLSPSGGFCELQKVSYTMSLANNKILFDNVLYFLVPTYRLMILLTPLLHSITQVQTSSTHLMKVFFLTFFWNLKSQMSASLKSPPLASTPLVIDCWT